MKRIDIGLLLLIPIFSTGVFFSKLQPLSEFEEKWKQDLQSREEPERMTSTQLVSEVRELRGAQLEFAETRSNLTNLVTPDVAFQLLVIFVVVMRTRYSIRKESEPSDARNS